MLKIRLQRVGKKHDPSFRVVLVDSRRGPKSGNFIEILGNYNAQKGDPVLKGERIKELMAQGAQVSDTVHNLLVSGKIIEGKKHDVLKHTRIEKKLAKKKEAEPDAEEGAEAPVETPKEEAKKEDKPAEPVAEEKTEEPKTEEKKEEKPAEDASKEDVKEEPKKEEEKPEEVKTEEKA